MDRTRKFQREAKFIRISTNSTDRTTTLLKAVGILARFKIPHCVFAGYAVQERGYPRFTVDVDLIVPDVKQAQDILAGNGFKKTRRSKACISPKITLIDRETNVAVDLFQGGIKVVAEAPLPLPMPTKVTKSPNILKLPELVSSKLSGFVAGGGAKRSQDLADAVELMMANKLDRDFQVASDVQKIYKELWDGIRKGKHPDLQQLAHLR